MEDIEVVGEECLERSESRDSPKLELPLYALCGATSREILGPHFFWIHSTGLQIACDVCLLTSASECPRLHSCSVHSTHVIGLASGLGSLCSLHH